MNTAITTAEMPQAISQEPISAPTKMLKLLFIVENDEPHAAAGGFYAIYKFAEFLAQRGHAIVIYGVHDMSWVRPNSNLHLRFRPSLPRKGRFLTKVDRTLSTVAEALMLPDLIRKFEPDWILGVLTYSAIRAEKLGKKFKIPVANFIYECPPWMREVWGEEVYQNEYHGFVQKLWEDTHKSYLGSRVLFPNSLLSQSKNQDWLAGKDVAEPIYPGIDPDQMPFDIPDQEPIILEPGLKHLLFVGRMVTSKNIPLLIKAFKKLTQPAVLHLCGTGPDMASFKSLGAGVPNIRFHGFVSDEILWSLFRQCDLVVYPSGFEGFGMPPMQALYFGKACLASDLAIFRSIYGDGLEYFPSGDEAALVTSLRTLLQNGDYCRQRGLQGRKFVLANFTWTRAAERIENTLIEAMES